MANEITATKENGTVKGNQGRKAAEKVEVFGKVSIKAFLTESFHGAASRLAMLYQNSRDESKIPFSGMLLDGWFEVTPKGKVTLSTLPGRDDSREYIAPIAYVTENVERILSALSPEVGGTVVSSVAPANRSKARAFLASLGQDTSPDDSGDSSGGDDESNMEEND